MAQHGEAGTDIDTEVGVLPFPVDIVLVTANVEAELRTGKEEHVGRAADAEGVAQVDGNGDLLLCEALLMVVDYLLITISHLNLSRSLVVERGGIKAEAGVEQRQLDRRTDIKALTVV